MSIAGIFRRTFRAYARQYNPSAQQYKAAGAIMACRTPVLGSHAWQCGECDSAVTLHNSCRDRHCPVCGGARQHKWVQQREHDVLPAAYFHLVFTVPSELNPFALRNQKPFYDLLFRAVRDTLYHLAAAPRWLNALPGFTCVLHTWGGQLWDHPHIHCLIPAGGITALGKWKASRYGFLFPQKAMQKVFRAKLLAGFRQAAAAGDIIMHGSLARYRDSRKMKTLLNSLYRKQWVVYFRQVLKKPESVVRYLGRYISRIAISESRIIANGNGMVTFRYTDHADHGKKQHVTITETEFIRRFLLHVLPKGFTRVRHYGFLANRNAKSKIASCLERLRAKVLRRKAKPERPLFPRCPVCGKPALRLLGFFLPRVPLRC